MIKIPEGLPKEPGSIHAPKEGKAKESKIEVLCAQRHFLLRCHLGAGQIHSQLCAFI